MNKTIESVIKNNLCTGCGTCVGLCPNKSLKLVLNSEKGTYSPKLNKESCIECSICYEVCPGSTVNFEKLNEEIFGKKPRNILVGNHLGCYTGYATNRKVRLDSSSGGIVTELLIFALESGMIDGALVTKMRCNEPLKPNSFIARKEGEIIEASKSKYCPVPANLALSEILESDGKFAVIGLPCHIQGVRKAERINKKLKERIVLHLGLFCGHVPNFWATDLLLQRTSVEKSEIIRLDYRGEGWPGFMKISLKNGTTKMLPWFLCWDFLGLDFFTPRRCLMCSDGLNELADLSFGDAWLPDFSDDNLGTSIVIARSSAGKRLLRNAKSTGKIELEEIAANKVIRSQLKMIYFKKKIVNSCIKLFRQKIKYDNILKPNASDYLLALFLYLNNRMFSIQSLKKYPKIPMKAFHAFYFMYNLVYSRMTGDFVKKAML